MASRRNATGLPLLTRNAREAWARADLDRLGLPLKQYSLLVTLLRTGAIPQAMVCDLTHMAQNTVVLWLNELEDAGLVERRRDPGDRRKHFVEITDAGRAAVEDADRRMLALEEVVLAGLTREERTQLYALLAKNYEALDPRAVL